MNRAFMNVWLADSKGWDLAFRGIITGANTLMGLVAAPVGGLLATRYGEKKWTVWALIAAYICYALAYILPLFTGKGTLQVGGGYRKSEGVKS